MLVDTVVKFLLTDLTRLLKDEAKLLYGVEEKVILLQQELQMINVFLRSSQGKRDKHEMVKVVVGQIRDVAYEAQDVIDNYVVDITNHNTKGTLKKFFHSFDKGKMLHTVNNQIEKIKTKIKDIYDGKDKYDIDDINSSTTTELSMAAKTVAKTVQRRRSNVEENEVVGFDVYADEVAKLLLQGETSLQVVSIVGMVGCGKTTLARKVCKDPRLNAVNFGFDCLAWEFATKEFNANQLLLSLLRTLHAIPKEELKEMQINMNKNEKEEIHDSAAEALEFEMLKSKLREYLSDMKYLIVIDDVWSSHVFEEIRDAFPDDNMGSRILITTRGEDVAKKISTTDETCYQLKRLSDEDSWVLLSKKVFMGEKNSTSSFSSSLETAGRNIAIACKGLPLAIVVIAGILRGKEKSERVWKKVMGNVNWYINHEDEMVKEIVRLSYDNLPNYLKPCFLYFGIYPEDYEIPVRPLVRLWIAEGFIEGDDQQYGGSMVIEDIAEEFLEELISRNLIQVESRRTDGGVKTCRIHDLLRDLCISESILESFLEVRTNINISKGGKPRRLSLQGTFSYYLSQSTCDHSSTRSFFSFSKDEIDGHDLKKWLRENFKLIRVLDMGQVNEAEYVVGKIEESIHLRYLRIGERKESVFPNSLYNLWNLETLDLRGSEFNGLPDGIWKLKRLRHLYMSGPKATIPNIPGKKVLPNIQTISVVGFNENIMEQLRKGKFPNLRKLGVHCYMSAMLELSPIAYFQTLDCLVHLNTLKIIYPGKTLNSTTTAVGFPPNITKITLVSGSYLSEIVKSLGSLTKLMYLKITEYSQQYNEFELNCTESGCFPQLQVLKLTGLKLKKWILVKGGMPQLRLLVINWCSITTTLPSVEFFPNLQEVQVLWSSKELVDKVKHLELNGSCKLTVYPALAEYEEDPNSECGF